MRSGGVVHRWGNRAAVHLGGLRADLERSPAVWTTGRVWPTKGTHGAGAGPYAADVEVAVLGPVEVTAGRDAGRPRHAQAAGPRGRARAVARPAGLGRRHRRPAVGRAAPPAGVTRHPAGLRLAACAGSLEPDRQRRAPATVLVTVAPGLRPAGGRRTRSTPRGSSGAVDEQHRRLQPLAAARTAGASARRARATPCAGWTRRWPSGAARRTPSSRTRPPAVAERARLEELRAGRARGPRGRRRSPSGQHATVAGRAGGADRGAPAARAALGAARPGADPGGPPGGRARGAARGARRCSTTSSGLEPGAELRDLQTAVLRQDPVLEWVAPPERAEPRPVAPRGRRPGAEPVPSRSAPPGRWSAATPSSAALVEALDTRRVPGTPAYAVLTGEPGIGKTRLAAELAAAARERGRPGAASGGARRTTAPRRCGRGRRSWRARTAAFRETRATDDGGASSGPGSGSPAPCATRPASEPRAGGARRPALGRHLAACGCCGCWSRPRRGRAGCWCCDLARQPRADRRARRRRRGAGPPARRAPRADRARPRRVGRGVRTVADNRPSPDAGRRAARSAPTATRSSSWSTPASPASAATSPQLLAEEHPPAGGAGGAHPAAGAAARARPSRRCARPR